jgi:parallel beta-helix repeat protein
MAYGATYYVGTSGSNVNTKIQAQNSSTPWLTVNYGISQLVAGDLLIVQDGTYREALTITVSGAGAQPITIKAQSKGGVMIDGTKLVTGWTPCQSNEPDLTVGGVTNTNYANIYWAEIDTADVPDIYKAIMFEDREHLFFAQYPDQCNRAQDINQDLNYLIYLQPEAYGQTAYLLDSDVLGSNAPVTPLAPAGLEAYTYDQPDDYWNSARIVMYSHGANNSVVFNSVADFIRAEHKLVFSTSLTYALTSGGDSPDSYALLNHPHTLSRSGEYYIKPIPVNGKYRIYLWPRTTTDLTDKISVAVLSGGGGVNGISGGIYGYGIRNVVLDGLTVTGFTGDGIRFRGSAANSNTVTVRNCHVHRNHGWGIYINYADYCVVESCDVYLNTYDEARGIHLTDGKGSSVRYNRSARNGRTCISFYTMRHSQIIGNQTGTAGTHGNGISCYLNCDTVLVAYNCLFPMVTGITIQDFGNITIFGNLLYGPQSSTIMNSWGHTTGKYNRGPAIVLQNTAINNQDQAQAAFTITTDTFNTVRQPVRLFNNILHGDNSRITTQSTSNQPGERGYNLYTKYGWTQGSSYGWQLGPGEIDARATNMNTIFTDTTSRVFFLKQGSPAIGVGKNLDSLITAWRLKAMFPDFDFSRDMNGTSWAATPSMGCYEYAASRIRGPGDQGKLMAPNAFPNPLYAKDLGWFREIEPKADIFGLSGKKADFKQLAQGGVFIVQSKEYVKKIVIIK